MTKAYDYSEYDVRNMVYQFADLSKEEAQAKRKEWDDAQAEKLKAKEVKADVVKSEDETDASSNTTQAAPVKKVFIPKIPVAKKTTEEPKQNIDEVKAPALGATELKPENDKPNEEVKKVVPPKIKIAIPKKIIKKDDETNESNQQES